MSKTIQHERESDMNEETILEIRNASVTFDMDRGTSRVLNDVSVDVKRNEILGIVGESGSGKSMFADSMLNAVVEPGNLSGEIIYHPEDGQPVDLANADRETMEKYRWKEVSMVFQGAMSSFNPTQKIKDHFTETIKAHGHSLSEGMAHARSLLTKLHLDPERVLTSYPHELSGGMQQRALIALSLVLKPRVLVMDEPTAALDLLMQRSILGLLAELQEEYGLTVVFITHDLPLVAGLADRIGVMYAFELAEIGPADQMLENPAHPYTRDLLNAVPNLNTPLDEMKPIEGSSPDPVNDHTGCQYASRCSLATSKCHSTDPPFEQAGDDHETACFHWERAREEIPMAIHDDVPASDFEVQGKQSVEPVVTLDDVDVHFENKGGFLSQLRGESETVYAVNDIDLDIYENDVVALIGESGCGKSTLGKTAIGIQRPTDGSLDYRGQDVWETRDGGSGDISFNEIRQSLQLIHQDPGSSLNPNMSVAKVLAEPLKQAQSDLSFKDRRERILGMLEYVGLTPAKDYAERYPHQLSGGEKQRVALIRALFMNPDLIFADEAVSALDVSLRVEMMDLMLELQDRFNTSYLFISHNLENARYLAGKTDGRIGVMYLGNIVEIGPAEEMITNPKHPYTKVLRWSTTDVDPNEDAEEPPIRGIDIPDPVDPPSGCPFQTRCPKAREHCTKEVPSLEASNVDGHSVACFREQDGDHPYWDSEPVEEVDLETDIFGPDLPPAARPETETGSGSQAVDD
ncbi:ABC transporter ATP-binding protein [Haloferax sp. AB510]|uniref:ABC transporter ATP-binding protein n=1 Tax=Haloferax sp. AB510 TaxID=2934172 RepID=UPI00209C646D|nr:ABC transporter ATP-binding protein [Haloferax sp. AB510]MCO8266036.1 ABC transporter ATP-binding protein [Haloferax sp. AB510]